MTITNLFSTLEVLLFLEAFLRLPYTFRGVSRPNDVARFVLTVGIKTPKSNRTVDMAIKLGQKF